MSYEEFINLQKGDTVEDSDGVLGKVDSIVVDDGEVWVFWEDRSNGFAQWSYYEELNKY